MAGRREAGLEIEAQAESAEGERKLIGQILIEMGGLTSEQLNQGLAAQREKGGVIGQILQELNFCSDIDLMLVYDEEGTTREEFLEIFSVGPVVGGSIVIPHLRRAMARLEELAPAERTV